MFIQSHEPLQLNRYLKARTHQRYSRIVLVSPFYEPAYLSDQHYWGRFLYRAREDGTEILIVLRELFRETEDLVGRLEVAGAECYVLSSLHSKLYVFDAGHRSGSRHQPNESVALVGSANMTTRGWRLDENRGNEELCVRLGATNVNAAYLYARQLARKGQPFRAARRGRLRSLSVEGTGE